MKSSEILDQIKKRYPELNAEILQGFYKYKSGDRPDPKNSDEMQGWTIGWGFHDHCEGCICAFPNDRDYMAGWEMLS